MEKKVIPIFIFSLPRSGSTLLQRILMSHKEITSVSEPWLLLPLLYSTRKKGQLSEYSCKTSELAINEFINNLPIGKKGYNQLLNSFVCQVYGSCCNNNEVYFLDKTPRYHLIINEIAEVFPFAKFIFLFRNPVHVYSSILTTWGKNRFKRIFNYDIDLKDGVKNLSNGYTLLQDKALSIQYEELIQNPNESIIQLFNYLGIEKDKTVLEKFTNQKTTGSFGDQTGIIDYKKIEPKTLNKWKDVFTTTFRKKHILTYVKSLNNKDLEIQGYSKKEILAEIEGMHVKKCFGVLDRIDLLYSYLVQYSKINIFIGKSKKRWTKGLYLS